MRKRLLKSDRTKKGGLPKSDRKRKWVPPFAYPLLRHVDFKRMVFAKVVFKILRASQRAGRGELEGRENASSFKEGFFSVFMES